MSESISEGSSLFRTDPVPHLVVDGFLSAADLALVWGVVKVFRSRVEIGEMWSAAKAKQVKDKRKRNHNTWLTDEKGNPLLEGKVLHHVVSRRLTKVAALQEARSEAIFAGLRFVRKWNMLLSIYEEDGHMYGAHRDASWVTASLMLQPGKTRGFTGGDFLLQGFEDGSPKVRVPFEHNRLVIFPGLALHAAEKISRQSEGFSGSRVTIQVFPALY